MHFQILLATSNAGKLRDFTGAAAPFGITIASIPNFSSLPQVVEDGATFEENARKKAESYLEFLGKHDALTKLRNRAFYDDEIARLNRRGPFPVGVLARFANAHDETHCCCTCATVSLSYTALLLGVWSTG